MKNHFGQKVDYMNMRKFISYQNGTQTKYYSNTTREAASKENISRDSSKKKN